MALPVAVVQESIADELVNAIVEKAKALKVGPAYDKTFRYGTGDQRKTQRICDQLDQQSIEEGAQLVLDGRGLVVEGYENGFYVGPTILDHVKPE